MKFKLSFSLLALKDKKKLETLLKILKEQKIKYIEIPIFKFFPRYLMDINRINKFKKILKKYDIKISSAQAIFYKKNLNILSKEDEIKVIRHLRKIIYFCKKLKIVNIIFGSPANRIRNKIKSDNADKIFKNILDRISGDLKKSNVNFCIEPNSKFYNCNYINNTEQALKFLKKNDLKNVYINFDTGNALLENDKVKVKKIEKKYFKNFQISEKNLKQLKKNYKRHLKLLKKLDLENKFLSLEMLNVDLHNIKKNLKKFKLIANKI